MWFPKTIRTSVDSLQFRSDTDPLLADLAQRQAALLAPPEQPSQPAPASPLPSFGELLPQHWQSDTPAEGGADAPPAPSTPQRDSYAQEAHAANGWGEAGGVDRSLLPSFDTLI